MKTALLKQSPNHSKQPSKRFALIALICLYTTYLSAQTYRLTGCVKDRGQTAIEMVNAVLLHVADSTYLDGSITDMNGCFSLNRPKGAYILRLSLLGYEPLFLPVSLDKDTNLGELTLKESAIALGTVTVTGNRPVIKREIDRIVFDAANSIASVGGNALNLLRDVPGLEVGENSISVIGKGSVKVYVNGRETKLSGNELTDYLRNYNAHQIDKVEVITTPPARYDAEGNAGIINIRLKARPNDYLGGSATGSYTYGEQDNFGNAGLNMNYSQGKISAFVNIGTNRGDNRYQERSVSHYPLNDWKNRSDYSNEKANTYGQGGLDIALGNRWNVGTQFAYSHQNNDNEITNRTDVCRPRTADIDSVLTSLTHGHFDADRMNANLHLDKTWGTMGKKMLLDIDYLNDRQKTPKALRSHTQTPDGNKTNGSDFDYNSNQRRQVDVLSSALDFILPCNGYAMSVGAKAAYTHTRNRIAYNNSTVEYLQDDYFQYKEQIYALYADYSRKVSKQFTFKLGVRMEHTRTEGISKSENRTDKHAYTRLFPTAYFLYAPNESNAIGLSFSNRLSRPAHNMVNPFTMYQNSHHYARGKEDLKPSYSYNTELSYTLKNNFHISVYHSYQANGISQIITLDPLTNTTSALWDNFLTTHQAGLNNSYTLRTNRWQAYLQHGVTYSKSRSSSPVTPNQATGWSYNAAIRNTFYFNKRKTFVGSLSATYISPQKAGVYQMEQNYNISAGIRCSLLKNKLSLSLNADDLLHSSMKGEIISNGMIMNINNSFRFTSVTAGISYTFGANIKSKQRSGSNSDITKRL